MMPALAELRRMLHCKHLILAAAAAPLHAAAA
jgi:hypothetical protein